MRARLLSLDVVRGITIAFMIMVNNNGGRGSWHFMKHAAWNGLTATDLVFPTFVFVMGVSVVLAIEARLARGATRQQLAWHAVQRAVILCLPGIVVNSFHCSSWRTCAFTACSSASRSATWRCRCCTCGTVVSRSW